MLYSGHTRNQEVHVISLKDLLSPICRSVEVKLINYFVCLMKEETWFVAEKRLSLAKILQTLSSVMSWNLLW